MVKSKYTTSASSIKFKIFAYLIGFCAMLLLLLWFFQIVFLTNMYRSIKISEIRSAMNSLISNLKSNDDVSSLADDISTNKDMDIQVYKKDSGIIYVSNNIIKRPSNFQIDYLLELVYKGGGEIFETIEDRPQKDDPKHEKHKSPEMIINAKIGIDSLNNEHLIIIYSIISPVDATVGTLRIELYFITAFMILFSILLALLISKKVSDPIIGINDSAKTLALGKYDVEFKAQGYKEISELSDTLNYAARELSKVEKLRRELIANVSHDLKTPLTLIEGYAEAMRDLPGENSPENAQIIMDEAKRLNTLVNDMLDVSKIQAGIQRAVLNKYNLTQSIQESINRLLQFLKDGGYSIDFEYDRDIEVMADEVKISQAFYNLLTNAVNFTGKDKHVLVRQIDEGNYVKIEVIDTGIGVDEKDLPYIWDRYYRTGEKHKRAVVGSGIGLSIVKSVIEMHNGECGVKSKQNEGSNFWFRLKK